jgi:hypothetical protein
MRAAPGCELLWDFDNSTIPVRRVLSICVSLVAESLERAGESAKLLLLQATPKHNSAMPLTKIVPRVGSQGVL